MEGEGSVTRSKIDEVHPSGIKRGQMLSETGVT